MPHIRLEIDAETPSELRRVLAEILGNHVASAAPEADEESDTVAAPGAPAAEPAKRGRKKAAAENPPPPPPAPDAPPPPPPPVTNAAPGEVTVDSLRNLMASVMAAAPAGKGVPASTVQQALKAACGGVGSIAQLPVEQYANAHAALSAL